MAQELPVGMIATDVDGTLVSHGRSIPQENLSAIRRAQQKGVIFTIASGRFPENLFLLMRDAGIRCPIIGANGGRVIDEDGRVISQHLMNTASAMRVLDIITAFGADYFLFAPLAICTPRAEVIHHSELSQRERLKPLGFTYYHGANEARALCGSAVLKFYICDNVPLAPIREALQGVPDILITRSSPANIEVMPAGVDKGMGVREFAQRCGVPLSHVMALGDEENDIPMIAITGYGTAMGNASDPVKAAAKYVTASCEDCGFARAIEKYVL